jgi:hypothetical protein
LTLTFVESRYPRELLGHLQEVRGYTVEERWPGIYIVRGDILPIQIIDSRRLSGEENIWLKDLDNKLDAPEMRRITAEIERQGKAARIKAYLDVIIRANKEILKEDARMSYDPLKSLEKTLVEVGFSTKWETIGETRGEARGLVRGEEKKAAEIAGNLLKNGFSVEQTAALAGMDIVKVKALTKKQRTENNEQSKPPAQKHKCMP